MLDKKKHRIVIISATAKENFEKILQETEEKFGNRTSLRLILRFEKFISIIGLHPYLFGFYIRSKNIRKFILTKSHLILYKSKRKEVEIIAIVYQRQKRVSLSKM